MLIASVDSNDCAAGNFRSMATLDDAMEGEVRQILHQVMKPAEPAASSEGLGSRIHNHFARLGGAELELPSRSDTPATPDLMNAHPRMSLPQPERQNSRFNRY